MSLNVNTIGIVNHSVGQSLPASSVVHCNKFHVNFQADNQDKPEDSIGDKNHKTNKMNIVLGSVLSVGLLIGADFVFNHGKVIRGIWNKIHLTKQVSKPYVNNIEQVQQHFSQIFGKDFSKDEANELAKKYQELMCEEDISTLSDKLFMELKKDYGLHGVELKKAGHINLGNNKQGGAVTNPTGTKVIVYLDCIKDSALSNLTSKEALFSYLCHELCHVRQNRILYRADKERLIDILSQRAPKDLEESCWDNFMKSNNNNREQAINAVKNELKALMERDYGNVDNLPQKTTEEIEALFQNKLHYKYAEEVSHEEYVAQPIEKEANAIDNVALKLLELLGIK